MLSPLRGGRCFCFLPLSDLPVTANVTLAPGTAAPRSSPFRRGNTRSPDEKLGCKAQREQSGVRKNRAWERGGGVCVCVCALSGLHSPADPALIVQGLQKHPQQATMPLSNATFWERGGFSRVASHPDFAPLISGELHKQHRVLPRWHSFILWLTFGCS